MQVHPGLLVAAAVACTLVLTVLAFWAAQAWLPPEEPLGGRLVASATLLLAWATLLLVFVTGALALFALRELRAAQQVAGMDELLTRPEYQAIANNIVTGYYERLVAGQEPLTPEAATRAWNDLRRYLGLFERIGFLVQSGQVEVEYVWVAYHSRLEWIVCSPAIRQRILSRPQAWQVLIWLWDELQRYRAATLPDEPGRCTVQVIRRGALLELRAAAPA